MRISCASEFMIPDMSSQTCIPIGKHTDMRYSKQHKEDYTPYWCILSNKVPTSGVKYKADVVCLQESPRERGGVGINHSAYEITIRKSAGTAIQKGSGLVVDDRTYLSRGANDNVSVTDVRRTGEKIMRIVNIYDQGDTQLGEK